MRIQLTEKRAVGEGCQPFVIAEVGSNWKTFGQAKDSIAMAKQCGADAVKFQLFTPEALYGMNCIDIQSLPVDWLPKLKEKADACGIEFLCSAFSPELIDAVNPFVNAHKLASAELSHIRILERLAHHGKPVLASTGAAMPGEIQAVYNMLSSVPLVLMYCVAAYPAKQVNLNMLRWLKGAYNKPVGFSDHTLDATTIPALAVRFGACVIEKHFTAFPELDSPDRDHSLTPDEFRAMVKSITGELLCWPGPTGEENEMILRHKRRLMATKPIAPGEEMREGVNFGIYRSLHDCPSALGPWLAGWVEGRRATRAITAGEGVGFNEINNDQVTMERMGGDWKEDGRQKF